MNKLLCFVMVAFSSLLILFLTEAKTGGFSIELIHRDSPLSPFYNRSITPAEVMTNAALRSISRIDHFRQSSMDESKAIESVVITNGVTYLMKISIGTPPLEFFAIADTGSDLIWIRCTPCVCYPHNSPLFDPSKSSTYQGLSCDSKPCTALSPDQYGCGDTKKCQYSYRYGGKSFTNGNLSTDTFVFSSTDGQAVSFPISVFGCGRYNGGQFTGAEAGIVGLGGGSLSLVSQLGDKIEHKFSYCLLPWTASSASKLRFGMEAVISAGEGVVSTPLVSRSNQPTFYYLNLEGISVGDKRVPWSSTAQGEGNIVIDSGTTYTMVELNFYNNVEAAIREAIALQPVQAPPQSFKLCYATSSAGADGLIPDMIFHFTGADVRLKPFNTFVKINDLECLSIMPSDDISIYGNVAQVNFQVEYDLGRKQVSFAPADCTK
ncbi:hypothetical protein L1049_022194 [Liquidambar formosana]|uniref:Peptidase A1 domain-containing protein n=1 Tax=Liquidambar formosana TaxID=63359 RepID=A0AAP0RC72_LIQFO